VVGQLGLRTGRLRVRSPAPAGENAGLRDNADGEKCTLNIQHLDSPPPKRYRYGKRLK